MLLRALQGHRGRAMDEVMRYCWIMLGGALGTAARYWASGVVALSARRFRGAL
jgi:hypothetical protein